VDIIPFVITILMLVFDFWVVKNVSGRLLVGLRWWNEVKEDGSSQWIFESLEDRAFLNPNEVRLFWISTFVPPLVWIIFTLNALIKVPPWIEWGILCILGVILSIANLVGYIKCARDARKRVKNMAVGYVTNTVLNNAMQQFTANSTLKYTRV